MSVVYWRLSCDFHSWAQGYSLRCGKQNHWCLSVCFEDCTNFQVSSWSYLEIDRNCLLCALCLWSGGGVCLWLPSCQGNTSGQEAVAGAGCTWWQTIAQGAGRMFPPGSILGRWKVAMLTMLLAKYEAILRILMQEECAVLHFEWPRSPMPVVLSCQEDNVSPCQKLLLCLSASSYRSDSGSSGFCLVSKEGICEQVIVLNPGLKKWAVSPLPARLFVKC